MQHTVEYLHKFGEAANFKRIAMGQHNYNTAKNYLPDEMFIKPDYKKEELMKLPDLPEMLFYSEVLTSKGFSEVNSWSWLKG